MEQKNNARGGARPGSGRKASKDKKKTISFRLKEETINNIRNPRDQGYDVTAMLEDLVTETLQSCK